MKPPRKALHTAAFAFASLVAGVVIWATGLIAVSQYTEDLCFDDLEANSGYGSYHSEETLWPPSFECRLAGSDVEPIVVHHRLVALAGFGTAVVFPIVYGLVALFVVARWSRRRFISPDQAQ